MNKLKNQNPEAEIVTIKQACERTNLGTATVRRLADECKASIKIGKSYRIRMDRLLEYIYTFEA
jgi:excisionase family DNA binding protein